jgi:3-oxoacyl-(acyl-carrier-protein) synthase
MVCIHQNTCLSPQLTFAGHDIYQLIQSAGNKLYVTEPGYEHIPAALLRRMGKAVRMGVGAALPLLQQSTVNGIIIGTAEGAMDECIKFLDQIIGYEEGMLTPGNFVQGTPNSIAGHVGLLTRNKGYNVTHVQRGLSFENALLDAVMLVKEHPGNSYLVGAVDEISSYNYNIDHLAGWYKKDKIYNTELFTTNTKGTIAGEGAAMFIVNNSREAAVALVQDICTLHTVNEELVHARLQAFISKNLLPGEKINLLLLGENGDNRLSKFYNACESLIMEDTMVARYKHMTGEFGTASAVGLWIGCQILRNQQVPAHMIKKNAPAAAIDRILLYNNFKGAQHSFILLSKPSI